MRLHLALIICCAAMAACAPGPAESPASGGTSGSPARPSPGASTTPEPSQPTGAWQELDVQVKAKEDAAQLDDVADGFRPFIEQQLGSKGPDGCTITSVMVEGVHPDGFVLGSSTGCDESQAVWAARGGRWGPLVVLTSPPQCSELTAKKIPAGAGIVCFAADGTTSAH